MASRGVRTFRDPIELADGAVATPTLRFSSDLTTGVYRESDGRLGFGFQGSSMVRIGRKRFLNLQGDPITSNAEWQHPPVGTDSEQAYLYMKLSHRDYTLDDLIYGIYAEIENQSITGGSFTKVMHFGRGDAHYVALFADPALHGFPSGGYGYEAAHFANATTGFLSSRQGALGFENSNPIQNDCVDFVALIHDDNVNPVALGYTGTTRGNFIVENSLGNSFVSRQSQYIPDAGVPHFKITDHTFRPLWAAFGTGEMHLYGLTADVSNSNRAAPEIRQRSYYWDGAAEQSYDVIYAPGISGAPTPTPSASLAFQEIVNGTPQAAEFLWTATPGNLSLLGNTVSAVGSLTLQTGTGTGLDLQGKDVLNVGRLGVNGTPGGGVTMVVQAAAGDSEVQRWTNSAGSFVGRIQSGGQIRMGTGTAANPAFGPFQYGANGLYFTGGGTGLAVGGQVGLYIDTSLNVAVGTETPDANLHVYKNPAAAEVVTLLVQNGRSGAGSDDANLDIRAENHKRLRFLSHNGGTVEGAINVESNLGMQFTCFGVVVQRFDRVTGHCAIGANAPTTDAILDVQGTTGAFMPPRLTTTERDALTPSNGMLIYNTTVGAFQGYASGAWINL